MDVKQWTPISPNLFDRATWISKLFFDWAKPLIKKSSAINLKNCDDCPEHLKAEELLKASENYRHSSDADLNLFKLFAKTFMKNYLLTSILSCIKMGAVMIIQAYFLGTLISSFNLTGSEKDFWYQRYASAIIIMSITICAAFIQPNANIRAESIGGKIRILSSSLVFKKVLRISTAEIKRINVGQMINLFANDVGKFDECARLVCTRLLDPLIVVGSLIFVQLTVGLPGTIGVIVTVIIALLTIPLTKMFKNLGLKKAVLADKRLKLTTDMITEVRMMKMFCWEDSYIKSIQKIRKKEMHFSLKNFYCKMIYLILSFVTAHISIISMFIATVYINHEINAKEVYMCFTVYSALQLTLVLFLGRILETAANAFVAFGRIQKILQIEEVSENHNNKFGPVVLSDVKSSWHSQIIFKDQSKFYLRSLNITLPAYTLTMVTGPVGSGKSMFLLTIANELFIHSGKVEIGGSITYLPQEPWLFPTTIRQNILFGLPYDEERYHNVIASCALVQDLTHFQKGDQINIDDKGFTVSGGQKARIALARAMYRESNIYLLDDPLSAVDARVAKHIWQNCFQQKNKTIILVSHCLHLLNDNNKLIYFENGTIVEHTFEQLKTNMEKTIDSLDKDLEIPDIRIAPEIQLMKHQEIFKKGKQTSAFREWCKMAWKLGDGYAMLFVIVFTAAIAQTFGTLFDILMSKWIYDQTHPIMNAIASSQQPTYISFTFLGILLILEICSHIIRVVIFIHLSTYAAERLHKRMLSSITRAKMQFFDTHNTGQIINRFSKDMQFIDDFIPSLILSLIRNSLYLLGVFVNAAYSNVTASGPMVLIICIMIAILMLYIKSIKSLKRVEASARSPIYTYMNCSINGVAVIRTHQTQPLLIKEFNNRQNMHSSIWFYLRGMNYWMCLICEIGGALMTNSVILLTLFLPNFTNSSRFGMGISSSIMFGGNFQFLSKEVADTDNMMMAIDRVKEYIDLPPEDGYSSPNHLPTVWPQFGKIVFRNLTLFYGAANKKALHCVNFEIKPKEKIGIVGRTGAGKSSIVTALFRMADTDGQIEIDDIDIKSLPLVEYRRKLSIIPQNPIIKSGSIRQNLDPLNQFQDENLWDALSCVRLKDVVVKMEKKLEDGMGQFSAGQKQLFCLARTLLFKNKILILDEATSNVDNQTDTIMQELIKTKFLNSTILVIAHRLQTVLDLDRIMVVENGHIVEFDEPKILLQLESSVLRQLVMKANIKI